MGNEYNAIGGATGRLRVVGRCQHKVLKRGVPGRKGRGAANWEARRSGCLTHRKSGIKCLGRGSCLGKRAVGPASEHGTGAPSYETQFHVARNALKWQEKRLPNYGDNDGPNMELIFCRSGVWLNRQPIGKEAVYAQGIRHGGDLVAGQKCAAGDVD